MRLARGSRHTCTMRLHRPRAVRAASCLSATLRLSMCWPRCRRLLASESLTSALRPTRLVPLQRRVRMCRTSSRSSTRTRVRPRMAGCSRRSPRAPCTESCSSRETSAACAGATTSAHWSTWLSRRLRIARLQASSHLRKRKRSSARPRRPGGTRSPPRAQSGRRARNGASRWWES